MKTFIYKIVLKRRNTVGSEIYEIDVNSTSSFSEKKRLIHSLFFDNEEKSVEISYFRREVRSFEDVDSKLEKDFESNITSFNLDEFNVPTKIEIPTFSERSGMYKFITELMITDSSEETEYFQNWFFWFLTEKEESFDAELFLRLFIDEALFRVIAENENSVSSFLAKDFQEEYIEPVFKLKIITKILKYYEEYFLNREKNTSRVFRVYNEERMEFLHAYYMALNSKYEENRFATFFQTRVYAGIKAEDFIKRISGKKVASLSDIYEGIYFLNRKQIKLSMFPTEFLSSFIEDVCFENNRLIEYQYDIFVDGIEELFGRKDLTKQIFSSFFTRLFSRNHFIGHAINVSFRENVDKEFPSKSQEKKVTTFDLCMKKAFNKVNPRILPKGMTYEIFKILFIVLREASRNTKRIGLFSFENIFLRAYSFFIRNAFRVEGLREISYDFFKFIWISMTLLSKKSKIDYIGSIMKDSIFTTSRKHENITGNLDKERKEILRVFATSLSDSNLKAPSLNFIFDNIESALKGGRGEEGLFGCSSEDILSFLNEDDLNISQTVFTRLTALTI